MKNSVKIKIDEFFSKYPLKIYSKNQTLVHGGDDPPGIIYIEKGQIREYDISDKGDEVVVNVFKPPAFFPMDWAINGTRNLYYFETSSIVEARIAPPEEVVDFILKNNDVMFDLLSRLYSGAGGIQRRMAHLMGGNAYTRVLYELLMECSRFGIPDNDGHCKLMIHEQEIARRAGLSRETVNREIRVLKKKNLLDIDHKSITIKNKDLLKQELDGRL